MSLYTPRRRKRGWTQTAQELIPPRAPAPRAGAVAVTDETALRHSAVWACVRLRANLISTFPIEVSRWVGNVRVALPIPPILQAPGGALWDYIDWTYATQADLDRAGNAIGLITEKNALNLPARIELQPLSAVSMRQKKGEHFPSYLIDGKEYRADQVWHARQYVMSGLPVGLSPIAYAAWSIGEYLSAQDFALDWFAGAGVPKARLKSAERRVDPQSAAAVNQAYRATVQNGDLFVHGSEWEYSMIQAQNAGLEWLESRRFGLADVARFFDAPADLIEAAISAPGTLTYANSIQRNLQFLVMSLHPAIRRRERDYTALLPRPREVKMLTDELLRMDPETRSRVISQRIADRRLTVTEAREMDGLPPLTGEQEAEFARLFGAVRGEQAASSQRRDPYEWEQVSPMSAVPYRQEAPEGASQARL